MLENEEGDHGKVSGKNGYQNEKKKTHTHTHHSLTLQVILKSISVFKV